MMWAVVLGLMLVLALAAFFLGERLFAAALEGRSPTEAAPPSGCCGLNLPVSTNSIPN